MPEALPGPLPVHAHEGLQQSQKREAHPWVPEAVDALQDASLALLVEPLLEPFELCEPLLEPLDVAAELAELVPELLLCAVDASGSPASLALLACDPEPESLLPLVDEAFDPVAASSPWPCPLVPSVSLPSVPQADARIMMPAPTMELPRRRKREGCGTRNVTPCADVAFGRGCKRADAYSFMAAALRALDRKTAQLSSSFGV